MNLSGMTLTQLQYLVAVEDEGSFRKAARACGVSQPGLSMQIRKLEELLEVTVYDRSCSPIVATDAGRRVLEQARVILEEAARMEQVAAELDGELSGPYRLGVIPTLCPLLLPRFVPGFLEEHPGVELTVEELETSQLLDRLQADGLDGALVATPLGQTGLHEDPLFREPMHVYLPRGHALLGRDTVRQKDLAGESVWILADGHCLGSQTLQLCKGQRPVVGPGGGKVRFRSGSLQSLTALVDGGLGVTILPELAVLDLPARRRRDRVRPFARPAPYREISLLVRRTQLRRAIAEALAIAVRESVPPSLLEPPSSKPPLDPRVSLESNSSGRGAAARPLA